MFFACTIAHNDYCAVHMSISIQCHAYVQHIYMYVSNHNLYSAFSKSVGIPDDILSQFINMNSCFISVQYNQHWRFHSLYIRFKLKFLLSFTYTVGIQYTYREATLMDNQNIRVICSYYYYYI